MTKFDLNIVNSFRAVIYLSLFVCITILQMKEWGFASSNIEAEPEVQQFWPPDMIPHPHLPELAEQDNLAEKV